MIKYFCDCCKKELENSRYLNNFEYLCHLDGILNGDNLRSYTDSDGNRISGRKEVKGLCIVCYNKILIESVKKFRDVQKEYEV